MCCTLSSVIRLFGAGRDTSNGVEPSRPDCRVIEKANGENEVRIDEVGSEDEVDGEHMKVGICGGDEVVRLEAKEDCRKLKGLGDPRKPTRAEV